MSLRECAVTPAGRHRFYRFNSKLPRVRTLFSVIKPDEFETDGDRFPHGVGLCFHKGRLHASFGHNMEGENRGAEEARERLSHDQGRTWSAASAHRGSP